jgi:hypothetical protein
MMDTSVLSGGSGRRGGPMTALVRRTTTLVGPNRLTLTAATAVLVALASAGTALLVLTGTSSVGPTVAIAPPLPTTAPLAKSPGVVVVPTPSASVHRHPVVALLPARTVTAPAATAVPVALAFAATKPAATVPAVPAAPKVPPVVRPALRRVWWPVALDLRHGRHLAKGHRLHSNGHVAPAGRHLARGHAKTRTTSVHVQREPDD